MAKIVYLILCHKNPLAVVQQAKQFTAAGDVVAIHFDGNASNDDYATLKSELSDNPNVVFTRKRQKCGWGEWSLVQASIMLLEAAEQAFPTATHFYLTSGDCRIIKSAEYVHRFLDENEADFIESFDFFESDWIATGIKDERLIYRHFFNERARKWWFYKSLDVQQRFGLSRKLPKDMQIMIGSQWWCLRRTTVEQILEVMRKRRDVMRFFKYVWIPDETFFQTLVNHVVPRAEIQTRSLTFFMFTDYGYPVTFYNDHYDFLIAQDYMFARKISPEATDLIDRLDTLYTSKGENFSVTESGRDIFKYVTTRGSVGRRFARRFWETERGIDKNYELLLIACKKWHVAKRLVDNIKSTVKFPALNYIFVENQPDLPQLGGLEKEPYKRTRHRRAILRMMFDHYNTKRILFCIDTVDIDMITDFQNSNISTKILHIQCDMEDDYLIRHTERIGLIKPNSSQSLRSTILPIVKQDIDYERISINTGNFDNLFQLIEGESRTKHTTELARFLSVSRKEAEKLANTADLFED